MPAKKKTIVRGKAQAAKKKMPVKQAAAGHPVSKITVKHARAIMSHVNGLLADQGFSARVSEMHFTPMDGDMDGCENCVPPQVCKRVCRMGPRGPVCGNECA